MSSLHCIHLMLSVTPHLLCLFKQWTYWRTLHPPLELLVLYEFNACAFNLRSFCSYGEWSWHCFLLCSMATFFHKISIHGLIHSIVFAGSAFILLRQTKGVDQQNVGHFSYKKPQSDPPWLARRGRGIWVDDKVLLQQWQNSDESQQHLSSALHRPLHGDDRRPAKSD